MEREEERARKRRRKELDAQLIQRLLFDKKALGRTMTSTGTLSPGCVPFWTVRNSLELRWTGFRASEGVQISILDVFLFGMDFKSMIWAEATDFLRKSGESQTYDMMLHDSVGNNANGAFSTAHKPVKTMGT